MKNKEEIKEIVKTLKENKKHPNPHYSLKKEIAITFWNDDSGHPMCHLDLKHETIIEIFEDYLKK